jgi:hypothetical protein
MLLKEISPCFTENTLRLHYKNTNSLMLYREIVTRQSVNLGNTQMQFVSKMQMVHIVTILF